jgi:hypothetical protein
VAENAERKIKFVDQNQGENTSVSKEGYFFSGVQQICIIFQIYAWNR